MPFDADEGSNLNLPSRNPSADSADKSLGTKVLKNSDCCLFAICESLKANNCLSSVVAAVHVASPRLLCISVPALNNFAADFDRVEFWVEIDAK